jgi:hypothetical protein
MGLSAGRVVKINTRQNKLDLKYNFRYESFPREGIGGA